MNEQFVLRSPIFPKLFQPKRAIIPLSHIARVRGSTSQAGHELHVFKVFRHLGLFVDHIILACIGIIVSSHRYHVNMGLNSSRHRVVDGHFTVL